MSRAFGIFAIRSCGFRGSNSFGSKFDEKLQKEIKEAAENLRDASLAMRDAPKRSKPKKKSRFGLGKLLVVGLVGAGLAVALS